MAEPEIIAQEPIKALKVGVLSSGLIQVKVFLNDADNSSVTFTINQPTARNFAAAIQEALANLPTH